MAQDLNTWLLWLHLLGVIVWSASAVGAYWIVLRAVWAKHPAEDWVRRRFLEVVWLEHAGFVLLIAAGLWRLQRTGHTWSTTLGADAPLWLRWKLGLFLCVALPFEAYDIWLSHWHLPRLLRRGGDATGAWRHHDRFMWIGGGILVAVIPVILWLAKFRPI